MPLVRIDVPDTWGDHRARGLADVVHDALVAAIGIPSDDRFQIIARHRAADFIRDARYPDLERSADGVIISITFRAGRTDAMKRALYRAIVDEAGARVQCRPDDVMIVVTENGPADWSFGGGLALHAPG